MKERENFLDKNTLIAIALVFLAWFTWDAYMRKKYPQKTNPSEVISQKEEKETQKEVLSKPSAHKLLKNQNSISPVSETEKILSFKSKNLSFDISSQGMGFKNLVLNQILDRKEKAVWLFSGEENLPFETRIMEKNILYFDIKPISKNSWEGTAFWKGVEIKKVLSVDPEVFLIETQIKISGDLSFITSISTLITQSFTSQKQGFLSFLTQPDFLSFFISSSKGFEQIPIMSMDESQAQELQSQPPFSLVKTVALGSKYFGLAWMEKQSDVLPQFEILFRNKHHVGVIKHSILNLQQDFNVSYRAFIGPKDFVFFKKEYPALIRWVDFGFFGSLSRFILQILGFFYSLAGNWGVSIILLTLLVRLLLLPFILSSHRSMEVMKKVHPEIQKVKTKFKDDPQRMNQEVMAIMKSHRANPLGGCLPLLLQIPVFWSLWRALANSYSLYRAPFVFWIQDLSWKDPYYVLPVLMGFFMFVQQKLSPVTPNKEMARVMQIMPVFMALFMINLPSGLVLYMLISTLFGLVQQIYLNKKGVVQQTIPTIGNKK